MPNKKTALLCAIIALFLLTQLGAQSLGDVNKDQNVNIVDALLIAQYYVKIEPDVFYASAADVNCSDTIDIVDALLIAQLYVNLIPELPCSISECLSTHILPNPGDHNVSFSFGGRQRNYILHIPSGLKSDVPLTLVMDFHGAYGNAKSQQDLSRWDAVAQREGFITVYPQGIDGFWNVDDTCCGTAGSQRVDDVGFSKAIVARLKQEMCIDVKRIYASGYSNGGGLAHRLGCDAADIFAAIAPVATDLRTQPCNASRPITMIEFRGMADDMEPYDGGIVGPPGGQYLSPGALGSLELWRNINQCTSRTSTFANYCKGYSDCADGSEAILCSLPGVGHDSYNNHLNFDTASVAWEVFKRHPLK